jgi:hypothetical protein
LVGGVSAVRVTLVLDRSELEDAAAKAERDQVARVAVTVK